MSKSLLVTLLWCVGLSMAMAQTRSITGTVRDAEGKTPIGSATVKALVSQRTTSSSVDGTFSIEVAAGGDSLLVSYLGYNQAVIRVGNASTVSVDLTTSSESLQEVIVTGFGMAQKKETLTGAIASIGAEDISRSLSSTTSGALVGKLAGVNFRQTDGRPGASTQLRIRNMGDPLYVIDGVQKDAGQFNNLDFNDIESISVLKDASAAIYGVRAANGVVVVTTKKGKRNTKNTISLTSNYGFQNLSTFPQPADAVTFVKSYIQSETVQGVGDYRYSPEDLAKWQQGTEKGYVPFDWYDYIWETSPQVYLNANVSGGSEKINYYFSVGHLNQQDVIVNYGGFKRTNVQMNINAQISERFKVGASYNARLEARRNPGVPGGDDLWLPRFATFRNLPTVRPFANDNPLYPQLTSTDPGTNFAWLNYDLAGERTEAWRVSQLNFDAEYDIIDGLKAKALVGYYFANQRMDNQEYTYKLYKYNEAEDTYEVDFENTNPWRERTMGHVEEMTSNIQLNYNKAFGAHNLSVIGGVETILRKDPSTWVHSIPTANALHLIDYETMDTYDDRGDNPQARIGYIGKINYDYNGKYLLELLGRYDGSWKFPPNDRWGFFPAASAGWRISQESFWQDSKIGNVVNDLKIRGSYGLVGDDNTAGYNPFDYMAGYNYKRYRNANGDWVNVASSVIDGTYIIGTQPRGLPVTTLSWLRAEMANVGFDAAFLRNRLTTTVEFFQRKRTGLPAARYDVLVPTEAGFALPNENLNSDMIRGYEAMVRWSDQTNDFSYSLGGNVTFARFFDWDRYKPRFSNSWDEYRNSLVQRYGYLNWGLQADGQFQSWEEITNWPIDNDRQGNRTLRPGDVKYKDLNGDRVINDLDLRPIGYRQDATPALNFGLNFAFAYKGFDLALDFSGGGMYTFYKEWEMRTPFQNGGNIPQYYADDAWKLSDIWDANSDLIPGKYPMLLIGNGDHSNYWNSDFWKQKIRYIKLRNLDFGYSLPKRILEPLSITGVRVYFSGQNLFTLTNLIGIDPEMQDTNGLGYPTMRIMNFGINVRF
ncbi:SusC/RagA family TonB-linked outer membrane protein [Parapedobacter defluvii]|uniref:SusC/RagA family TonB-linked outer membrane protein n=1 Tax=Parapedobacter defluvii TaxID=2045106 RepID=A0ABQ1LS25_9SPHI|nr:SusC/RagA family TonB-linked outer membrane protein [Parapedobacter defluvii]RQP18806.1 MAG: SusC/RagA family TonB-linked outer membrane protein [Parapedobacter sp.]GGC27239.1 SusC/RagA family TonB-linked outer membrane protein [Parapedobacter defluvii]